MGGDGRVLDGRGFFVAVTGAQGVGKSTFCNNLLAELRRAGESRFLLLDDLRGRVAATGVPLGSGSTAATIHAVWVAHLEREESANSNLVLLDRCSIDALAYTRVLAVSSDVELRLFEQIAHRMFRRIDLVIHLELSEFFRSKGKPHETAEHRIAVAEEVEHIATQSSRPILTLSADQHDAVGKARLLINEMLGRDPV
jgi:predicted ATPase